MPPKAKFTRQEVIDKAFDIVVKDGLDALTARSLGASLGSSPRPIFTVFNSMEEVQSCVIEKANAIYSQMVQSGLKEDLAFKGVGKAYIRFAGEYPKLFQLLFMRENAEEPDKNTVLQGIEGNYDNIVKSIEESYGFTRQTSLDLYMHLWIYSHGIAVLIATGVCAFTPSQISDMLTEVFVAILKKFKSEEKK